MPLDAIYASPLGRAQATAETIARRNGARVITVDALREIQPGDFGGTEIPAIFAAVRAFFARVAIAKAPVVCDTRKAMSL